MQTPMKSSEGYSEGRPFRDDRLTYCGRHVMRTDRQGRGAAQTTQVSDRKLFGPTKLR
jgi:hypothetical protein